MVERGLGVSLLPAWAVRDEVAWGWLSKLRIEGHRLRRTVAVISLARFQPAATRAFLEFVRERRGRAAADGRGPAPRGRAEARRPSQVARRSEKPDRDRGGWIGPAFPSSRSRPRRPARRAYDPLKSLDTLGMGPLRAIGAMGRGPAGSPTTVGTALATPGSALGRTLVSWTARVRHPDAGAPVGTTPGFRPGALFGKPRARARGNRGRDGATRADPGGRVARAGGQQPLPGGARRREPLLLRQRRAPRRPRAGDDGRAGSAGAPPLGRAGRRLAPFGDRLRPRRGPRRGAPLHRDDAPVPPAPLRPRRPGRSRRAGRARGGAAPRPPDRPGGRARGRDRGRPPRGCRGRSARGGRPLPAAPPHREPGASPRHHGGRGPGRAGTVLPLVGGDEHGRAGALELLHEQRGLCPLPQGHLRPVERVGPPLRVVQQPVVPQVHRVHAGRGGDEAVEVVRRLPRPRRALRREVRHPDP